MAPLLALALLAAPPPWAGLYFDGPSALGWGEHIELTPGQAFSPAVRPGEPPTTAPLRATATTLAFSVHGQPVRGTWGIIDGNLWIGILRRTGTAWEGELSLPRIPTPTRVRWSPRAGRLRLDGPAGAVRFQGVRAEELSGEAFVLVHGDEAGFRKGVDSPAARALGPSHCNALGAVGTLCRMGVLPTGPLDVPAVHRVAWHRHGDVMRTPWSVLLGPAGRIPVREAPAPGRYAGPLDQPNPRVVPPRASLQIAQARLDQTFEVVWHRSVPRRAAVTWSPDARGISREVFGYDCQMGHADVWGVLAWVPLADGRIFLWQRQPTHGADEAGGYLLTRVGP